MAGTVTGGTDSGIQTSTPAGASPTITLNSGANVSASSDVAIKDGSGNSTVTLNGGSKIKGVVNLGGGNDTLTNGGLWTLENCKKGAPCAVAVSDFGAGTNSLVNSGTITLTNTTVPGTSNRAVMKATGASAFSMTQASTIDMQDTLNNGLLTVEPVGTGSFITSGGVLKLDTQVAGDNAPSDILQINGNITSTTPTTIAINDLGGTAALTTQNGGIPLVKYTGSSVAKAFTAPDYQKSGFLYRLIHDPANKMWKLATLHCTAVNNPAYEEESVTITCDGLEIGEKITIPGTACQASVATNSQVTCTGTAKNIGSNPTVSILDAAGQPRSNTSAALSVYATTLNVIINGQIANGSANNTVEAKALDANGNPIAGAVMTFTPPAGVTLSSTTCTTDASGKCTVNITSTKAGNYPIAAAINGIPLLGAPPVATFVAGPATGANSKVEVTINGKPADGTSKNILTATALDANGNPVAGAVMTFTPPAGVTLSSTTCTTDASGTCTVNVTSRKAGSHPITVAVNGAPLLGAPPVIIFGAPPQPIPTSSTITQLFLALLMILTSGYFLQRKKLYAAQETLHK